MKNHYCIILVLILGFYFSAFIKVESQILRNSQPESSVNTSGGNKWEVSLSPKDRWFDTEVTVQSGTTINIYAMGFVTWAPPGGRDMSSRVDPNGTRLPFEKDKHRFPMPDAGCGSLIMKIGNSIYSVGKSRSIKSNESGTIQLMVNDDLLSDNSGIFFVDIEIPQILNRNKSNYLVFSSQKDGNQEVYQLDLAIGRATNLSQSGEDDGYPRCLPDGRRIAFATNRDGYWEIYLMNRDGSGQQNLTNNRGGNGYMDWSPDGQTLVFASTRNGQKNNEIYTIRADGSGLKRLTNHPAEDVHPVWSSDGRKIAFASERDGNRQIYVMNADGTNVIRLMSNRWYDDYPAWSPGGSQIAFSSDRDSKSSERLDIYITSTDGSNIKRIISHPSDDRHPAWSPDGSQLAFASNRDGDSDIYIIRADGTGLQKIFSSEGNDEHPHWCGDNTEEKGDTNKIPYPSTRTKIYKKGKIQLNVPDNWQPFETPNTVMFAPSGAHGDYGITHGALIALVQMKSGNLMQATEKQVSEILQANSYLRQKTGFSRSTIGGRSAFVTVLSGQSPITGKIEVVNFFTTLLSDGDLLYIALVSPENEVPRYKASFSSLISSIKFNPGEDTGGGENISNPYVVLPVEKIGPGRTSAEKMYQFTLPANQWAETSIKIKPNQEVNIHHFMSSERITVQLGGLNDSRLQQPGTILPLYTSTNCSTDKGVQARVRYTCVQLNRPESVKLFARQSVSVGIYISDR